MKILFYGGKGWIGNLIQNEWSRLYPEDSVIVSEQKINPNNQTSIEDEILSVKPDRIFSCLGRTFGFDEVSNTFINNIDYLENHLKENVNDNLYAPVILSILCQKHNIHFSYLGTGCIFSQDTRTDKNEYTEESIPDFFGSSYSVVKGYTDQLVKHFSNVANIRIRMPIVKESCPRNFITKILSYSKICSMPNSMTYLPDFIPIMIDISRQSKSGTYHCINKGNISHDEILQMYKQKYPDHNYELVEESEVNKILKSK
jgi:3,5-epimerase/4-reductase